MPQVASSSSSRPRAAATPYRRPTPPPSATLDKSAPAAAAGPSSSSSKAPRKGRKPSRLSTVVGTETLPATLVESKPKRSASDSGDGEGEGVASSSKPIEGKDGKKKKKNKKKRKSVITPQHSESQVSQLVDADEEMEVDDPDTQPADRDQGGEASLDSRLHPTPQTASHDLSLPAHNAGSSRAASGDALGVTLAPSQAVNVAAIGHKKHKATGSKWVLEALDAEKVRARQEREQFDEERKLLQARIVELQEQLAEQQQLKREEVEAKEQLAREHTKKMDLIKDAVGCGICMDTLDDPHILTCGHIACKTCLVQWFRTPQSLRRRPEGYDGALLPATFDSSHRTKECHLCRSSIIQRPARMYHLAAILEPLGVHAKIPTPSQAKAVDADAGGDPWRLSFPAERNSYRVWDEEDRVYRCRECHSEIDGGECSRCGVQYSDVEDDLEAEDETMDSDSEDDADGAEGQIVGAGLNMHLAGFALGADTEDDSESDESEEEEVTPGPVEGDDDDTSSAGTDTSSETGADARRRQRRIDAHAEERVDRQIARQEERLQRRQNNAFMDVEADVDDADVEEGYGNWDGHQAMLEANGDDLDESEGDDRTEESYESDFIDDDLEEEKVVSDSSSDELDVQSPKPLEDAEDLDEPDIMAVRAQRVARFAARTGVQAMPADSDEDDGEKEEGLSEDEGEDREGDEEDADSSPASPAHRSRRARARIESDSPVLAPSAPRARGRAARRVVDPDSDLELA